MSLENKSHWIFWMAATAALSVGGADAVGMQDVPRETIVSVLTDDYATVSQLQPDSLPPNLAQVYLMRMWQPQINRDAGPQYLKALMYLPETSESLAEFRARLLPERLDALRAGAFQDELAQWNGAQSFIRSGLVSMHCRLQPNTEFGIATLLPELSKLRDLTRWQLLSGDQALAQGKPWLALMRYRESIELGRDVASSGEYLIGALVGVAIQQTATAQLVEAIPALLEAGIDPSGLRAVVQTSHREDVDIVDALNGERLWLLNEPVGLETLLSDSTDAFCMAALRFASLMQVSIEGIETPDEARERAAELRLFGLSAEEMEDSQMVLQAIAAEVPVYLNLLDRTAMLANIEPARYQSAMESLNREVDAISKSNSIVRLMFPAMGRAVSSMRMATRSRHALNILCAAIEWRARHEGQWPASLADIAGSYPELALNDPLTGNPYTFRTDGKEIRVGWTAAREGDQSEYTISITK